MPEKASQWLRVSDNGVMVTNTPKPYPMSLTRSQTCLMEIVNYPLLHSASHRTQVLSKGQYDAILLVYDVRSRASFEHIKTLHAEISSLSPRDGRRRWPTSTGHRSSSADRGSQQDPRKLKRSLFGVFGGSPRDQERQVSASPRKEETGTTIVAVVGNKCDLEDGEDTPALLEEECDDCDETADDLNHALALFGYPPSPCSAAREHLPAPTTSNVAPDQHVLTRVRSCHSTVSVDGSIRTQVNEKLETAVNTEEVNTGSTPAGSQTVVRSRERQVSIAEGEALALELATNVSFFEASARTGENVEELFAATAKAVLTERTRELSNEDSSAKKCRQRCQLEPRDARLSSDAECTVLRGGVPHPGLKAQLELDGASNSDSVWPSRGSLLEDRKTSIVLEKSLESRCEVNERRRRGGLMERVRRVFVRRQSASVRHLTRGRRGE